MRLLAKKYTRINVFILSVLLLLGFAIFYFLYYQQRNQADIYVSLTVVRPITIPNYNAPYNWIPYWLSEMITVKDRETTPFSGVAVTVLEKQVYEGSYNGQFVNLLLKVRAVRDRSGIYLFKNKPLLAGSALDLKLSRAQFPGIVTYIGKTLPNNEYRKLIVTLKDKAIDQWVAESLKVGATIVDNNGQILVKVLDKRITLSNSIGVSTYDPVTKRDLVTYDITKRDLDVTVELLTKKVVDTYYFAENWKVKVGETLFLPFKEVILNNLTINSVQEIKSTT